MTKDELYRKLINAYYRHQDRNTKCVSYVDAVVKIVKEYLAEKEPSIIEVDQAVVDYWKRDIKLLEEIAEWKNNQGIIE